MNRSLLPLFLAASFLAIGTWAQEGQLDTPKRNPLWEVRGVSNVVYLLGSFHLLSPDDHPLSPVIQTAFSNSLIVVFEADEEAYAKPEVQQEFALRSRLPAGETRSKTIFPPPPIQHLQTICDEPGCRSKIGIEQSPL